LTDEGNCQASEVEQMLDRRYRRALARGEWSDDLAQAIEIEALAAVGLGASKDGGRPERSDPGAGGSHPGPFNPPSRTVDKGPIRLVSYRHSSPIRLSGTYWRQEGRESVLVIIPKGPIYVFRLDKGLARQLDEFRDLVWQIQTTAAEIQAQRGAQ